MVVIYCELWPLLTQELARRLHQEEVEARKKKATGSPKPSRQQHDPDVVSCGAN